MKNSIVVGVIGLIVGMVLSGSVAAYAVNGNHTSIMKMFAMNTSESTKPFSTNHLGSMMSMNDMASSLQGKTGDNFDKTFLSEMTSHHQGAIAMANLALANAKHQEVKDLAKNIVTAQTGEIEQMQMWQAQWAYTMTYNTSSKTDSMSEMRM
jgi:uncharacterized protein (DUF305 family)